MIYVAWWTGKGYQTIWIVVVSLLVFEVGRAALRLQDGVWVLGLSLMGAAVANWFIGREANKKSLAKVRSSDVRQRLFYRARHRFMSLPMETFSIILGGTGIGVIAASAAEII